MQKTFWNFLLYEFSFFTESTDASVCLPLAFGNIRHMKDGNISENIKKNDIATSRQKYKGTM
jgi:hypothetical protein